MTRPPATPYSLGENAGGFLMRQSTAVLFVIFICLVPSEWAKAQIDSLQPGITIEHALARGQNHSFSVNLEQDQFLQLVVDQHGIDVIVRVFSPEGKSLGEFDSPNGNEGPENVSVISVMAGVYRIEVAPLGQFENVPPGRYEIKIVELRRATEQELQAGKNQELLKARGLALLREVADSLSEIRLPQTRVRAQLQTSQLLWPSDEKLAAKLVGDAMEGVREYLASVDTLDQDYYQTYQLAMQLRQEVVQVLGQHDPETALGFLRTTRTLTSPEAGQNNSQWDQELQLELSLASQITARDPKRAVQLAENTLKKGYSSSLIEIISRLRATEPELAAKLAKEIAAKLQGEKLLKNQEASNLAIMLLRVANSPVRKYQTSISASPPAKTETTLLSEQEYKDLFEKTLAEALSYNAPPSNYYSPEKNSAQNILNSLRSMTPEMTVYAPASLAVVEKRVVELNTSSDPQSARWQKYQEGINGGTLDESLEEVGRAPREMREQLYQQVAQKALSLGDLPRARQILKDHVFNPSQRQQALSNLDQQTIQMDVSKGGIEDALRGVSNLRTSKERAMILSQIVNQIGPGRKRAVALDLLEQARNMVGVSTRVENQEQMSALLEIARAFSRYDSKRAFEVIEPLLDQFNEMSAAALVLNGFGQQYYQDGELAMQNGSSVANTANQLILALGTLATSNFDRAKAGADRLERPEVRINVYLAIAQQAIGGQVNGGRSEFRRF
ncbi:MAG TPA: hypothetical protein DCK93_12615 [Blastocatellia bacterium]|nr:hypothetical protein [Blastocatellia bacterium]